MDALRAFESEINALLGHAGVIVSVDSGTPEYHSPGDGITFRWSGLERLGQ